MANLLQNKTNKEVNEFCVAFIVIKEFLRGVLRQRTCYKGKYYRLISVYANVDVIYAVYLLSIINRIRC